METQIASVYLLESARKTDRPFDYTVSDGEEVTVGAIVTVPFGRGNRPMNAVVTAVRARSEDDGELKCIASVSDTASLTPELLSLAAFMRERTLCTIGDAVRTMIPPDALAHMTERYFAADFDGKVKNGDSLALCEFIRDHGGVTLQALKERFGAGIRERLVKLTAGGYITVERCEKEPSNVKYEKIYTAAAGYEETKATLDGERGAPVRGRLQRMLLSALLTGPKNTDELKSIGINDPASVSAALIKRGLVAVEKRENFRNPYISAQYVTKKPPEPEYSEKQREAVDRLGVMIGRGMASCALLHGVTGSGKTVVIKALIDRTLEKGLGAIVLVPEIALTPQTVSVYCGYFGDRVAVIHSSLSAGERYDAWRRVRDGLCDVVIGTRSAVFAPLPKLGLIVIDEEQEHTYKSDTTPKYLAHDIARKRCADTGSLLLLASATPSLASYYKAKSGIYTLVELKDRYGSAKLPEVVTVDMRRELADGNSSVYSAELVSRLREVKEHGGQAILFLNRRGYNSVVSCRRCGENIACPNCSVSLTYHATSPVDEGTGERYMSHRRQTGVLTCHYCGYRCAVPVRCPACGDGNLLFMGTGTQRAAAELEKLIPGIRVLRMDADTTKKKFSHEKLLSAFRGGEADVLLGTQMVTKGHDFPKVELVGVLNADASLFLDDYRAGERTFAMLTQVIGRAGRAGGDGVAVIQTSNPMSDIIRLAARQDYPAFYEREIALRKASQFPPFCDLCVISVASPDEVVLSRFCRAVAAMLKKRLDGEFSDVTACVYGPHEAPVYRVMSEFRMRFVIKCKLNARTREMFASVMNELDKNRRVSVSIDFNPSGL